MVSVDVRLERKEGILGGEAGVYCLPSRRNRDESVGKVNLVYIAESLRMGDDSILNLSCSFVPSLINIRNKKMKSRTHSVSPTLE